MTFEAAECEDIGQDDPFKISTSSALSFRVMEEAGLLPTSDKKEYGRIKTKTRSDADKYEPGRNILLGWARHERLKAEEFQRYLKCLTMGVIGGLAIIAPMLIMVLHNTLPITLAVASSATLLFALVLAWYGVPKEPKGALAATATYAAVLVVFIGATP